MRLELQFLFFSLLFTILFSMPPKALPTETDAAGWKKIGEQAVTDGVYYDEIEISEENTNVKRLKIKTLNNDVYINSIKIIYKGNTSESHSIDGTLDKGKSSDAFKLIGHYRMVKKVLVNYGKVVRAGGKDGKGGAKLVVMAKM